MRTLTRRDVAALFRVSLNSLYAIPGLAACRVVTGLRVVRYDAAKVEALFQRRAA